MIMIEERHRRVAGALIVLAAFASCVALPAAGRQTLPLDADWRFHLGDAAGAEKPGFAEEYWRALDVPHDWSIEGEFAATNRTGGAGGFLPAGIGWYRKHFTLPSGPADRRVFVGFDGVMANSDVWINGFHLGHRPNGYVSFQYELTDHLNREGENVLVVRADNAAQPASRWYAGAGIYRHVWLTITDPLHILTDSLFVSTPKAAADQALVRVQASVTNQSAVPLRASVQITVLGPDGQTAAASESASQAIGSGKSTKFQQEIQLARPALWDIDHPALYRAVAKVLVDGATRDEQTVPFGIRDARFEAATGFWLNGKNLKLKGVCLHHDGGAFGAAVPLGVWRRRLELLKQTGCNAIRTAHNPPAPEFLDLCDRLGFLVMDELFDCWTVGKNRYDYHLYFQEWSSRDTQDTVRRDRNHPSVILYSAGNEIRDTPRAKRAKGILSGLIEVFHANDPTHPFTQGLFRPNASHDYDDGLADLLDVIGQNYREDELLAAHAARPTRKIVGTENGHDRRVWLALRDNPPYAGQFLWTGFDYLGESRRWPVVGAGSGLFDRTGEPRPRAFQRQSWWSDRPMVYLARRLAPTRATPADPGFDPLTRRETEVADWTPKDTGPHDEAVEVFSNCEQVELLLNGKALGAQPLPQDASPRTWKVPFEPGSLEAVGKNKGQVVATCKLTTAAEPARVLLTWESPSRLSPHWDSVAFIRASVVDGKGVRIPNADDLITFDVSASGKLLAVDSGDNSSHESFRGHTRRAWRGSCVAIVQATTNSGKIAVTGSAPGLAPGAITLTIESSPP